MIPPSAKSKTKLKAFQFIEGRPSSQHISENDKENHVDTSRDPAPPSQASQTPMKSSSQPELVGRLLPPSTPAPRLPLAYLTGNGEAGRRAVTQEETPEESVAWVNAQTPGSSQPVVTPARKRKRARSSSPVSSSQRDQSNFFPNRDTTATNHNLQTPHPQADPSDELWKKYANAEGANLDKQFAHLIKDPSPTSPASAISTGGFRRWNSCGDVFPTSATKRRRTSARKFESYLPQEEEEPLLPGEGATKGSRTASILERMKGALTKSASSLIDGPSSSSPLPERALMPAIQEESPLRPRPVAAQEKEERRSPTPKPIPQPRQEAVSKPSSEYGDDDLDTDMLEAIEESTARPPPPEAQPAPAKVPLPQTRTAPPKIPAKSLPPARLPPKKADPPPDSDEFGDDDDDADLLAVDLEQITATYASQHQKPLPKYVRPMQKSPPIVQQQVAPPPVAKVAEDVQIISDDEFGDDDIDIEQLAAAEMQATQAFKASGHTVGLAHRSKT